MTAETPIAARRPKRSSRAASRMRCGRGCSSISASACRALSPTTCRPTSGVSFQAENGVIGLGARPPEGMEDGEPDRRGRRLRHRRAGRGLDRQRDELRPDPGRASRHDRARRACRWTSAAIWRTGWCPARWCPAWAARWTSSPVRSAWSSRWSTPRRARPRSCRACTLPLTATRRVSLIVTELAVIEPTDDGLVLRERAPGARSTRSAPRRGAADRAGGRRRDGPRPLAAWTPACTRDPRTETDHVRRLEHGPRPRNRNTTG